MSARRAAAAATVAALAATFALVLGGTSAVGSPAAGPEKVPNRLLVRADEYDLTLSRGEIGPGPALIQLVNDGEDAHDLQVRLQKGGVTHQVAEVAPGDYGTVELRLKKGSRYQLWCSLQNHRLLGMEAKLRVKRKPVE